jgi:uncharacterized membrane protein
MIDMFINALNPVLTPVLASVPSDAVVLAAERDHDGRGFFGFLGLLLLIGAGIAAFRWIRRRRHPEQYGPEAVARQQRRREAASAESILAERFAKGEMSESEFRSARSVLLDEPPSS